MSDHTDIDPSALGPNMWLIDEMYRRYREDPDAVGDAWREFFEDFKPTIEAGGDGGGVAAGRTAEALREASPHPTPRSAPPPSSSEAPPSGPVEPSSVASAPSRQAESRAVAGPSETAVQKAGATALRANAVRLRGAQERIAKNMEASLEVPTTTSVRFVPAKLIEENRRVI